MAAIPGAVYTAGKIHGDLNKFRQRSASDGHNSMREKHVPKLQRYMSTVENPRGPLDISEAVISPASSNDSVRSVFSGMIGSVFGFRGRRSVDGSIPEDGRRSDSAVFPTAGSIADLANLK